MNTLTISIGLLVLTTLVAIALHSVWQSYRNYQRRKVNGDSASGEQPISAAAIATASAVSTPSASPLRGEPSLGESIEINLPNVNDLPNPAAASVDRASANEALAELILPESAALASASVAPGPAAAQHTPASTAVPFAEGAPAVPTAAKDTDAHEFGVSPNSALAMATPAAIAEAGVAEPLLTSQVDCIIEFSLASPLPGQRLLYATQSIRRFGSKPALFDGQIASEVRLSSQQPPSEAAGGGAEMIERRRQPILELTEPNSTAAYSDGAPRWGAINPNNVYRAFRMGALLANRHGPLNAMEFAEFTEIANRLADHLGASITLPDMNQTLERARRLDADCIKLDAQLGLNIDCANALSGADLARIARDQGLTERGSNRFVRFGKNEELLFSLALADRPNRLTLLLDVPRAPVDQQPWAALLQCAHETMGLAQGHLVDDAGRALVSRNLDTLSAELAQRYAMLDQRGFKAGSALAMRVFN